MKIVICDEGGWRLTPLCVKTFYAKQGISCYAYRHANDGHLHKYTADEYGGILYYYSGDLGDVYEQSPTSENKDETIEYLPCFDENWRKNPDFISTLMDLGERAYAEGVKIRFVEVADDEEWFVENNGSYIHSSYYGEKICVKRYI